MNPLTEKQIRSSFVNASRREAAQATLPDLARLDVDRLDLLGWRDRRVPAAAYVVLELDSVLTGVLLRAGTPPRTPRRTLCAWCQDLASTDATLYVARRAGADGRAGNSVGTLICTGFDCSAHVRRPPVGAELGTAGDADADLLEAVTRERVDGLRERSARFVREVLRVR
ncbi:FBP domain-containing protein [Kineococcus sp. R8]|nr:FBP domain-containing protein [Kineococcus siccus]